MMKTKRMKAEQNQKLKTWYMTEGFAKLVVLVFNFLFKDARLRLNPNFFNSIGLLGGEGNLRTKFHILVLFAGLRFSQASMKIA